MQTTRKASEKHGILHSFYTSPRFALGDFLYGHFILLLCGNLKVHFLYKGKFLLFSTLRLNQKSRTGSIFFCGKKSPPLPLTFDFFRGALVSADNGKQEINSSRHRRYYFTTKTGCAAGSSGSLRGACPTPRPPPKSRGNPPLLFGGLIYYSWSFATAIVSSRSSSSSFVYVSFSLPFTISRMS